MASETGLLDSPDADTANDIDDLLVGLQTTLLGSADQEWRFVAACRSGHAPTPRVSVDPLPLPGRRNSDGTPNPSFDGNAFLASLPESHTVTSMFFEQEITPKNARATQTMDLTFAPGQEQAAKAVCHSCPVMTECLIHAITTGETHGIWGGANRQERDMLAAADPGTRAALDQIAAEYTPEDREAINQLSRIPERPTAEALRAMYEGEKCSIKLIADRYSRSATTVRTWLIEAGIQIRRYQYPSAIVGTQAGPTVRGGNREKPWTTAIKTALADGAWHDREDIVRLAIKYVPRERALEKAAARDASAKQRGEKGFGKTDPVRSGAVNIVDAAIHGLVAKSGTVERRVHNGRKQLRLRR